MLEGEAEKLDVALKFLATLKKFAKVVHACFGTRELDPNYEMYIKEFCESYRGLNISLPVKFHLVESHLAEFLKMYGEEHPLGFFSEQVFIGKA